MLAMENADAPPPDGSTATKMCCVFLVGSRSENSSSGHLRASMACTSALEKAFSLPSALMPSDSRKLRAGRRC